MSSDTTADVVTEAGSSPAKATKTKKDRRRPMLEARHVAPTFTDRLVTPKVLAPIIFLALSAGGYRWANSPTLVMLVDYGACALVLACYGVYLSFTKQSVSSALTELRTSSKERFEADNIKYGLLAARYQRRWYTLRKAREQRDYYKRKHAEAAGEVTRLLELSTEAERQQAEAARKAEWNEALAELYKGGSVVRDQEAWFTCFVDPEGKPIGTSKKGATHLLALAIPRLRREKRSPTGLLWVRFPKDGESPYEAMSPKVGVHILIVRLSSGEFTVTVTDLSRTPGDSKQRDHFQVTNPDGVAFVMDEFMAGVFREDVLTAYRDTISVGYVIGKALMIADYFQPLRWRSSVNKLRGSTMNLVPGHTMTDPVLEALSARFREAQAQRG